MKTRCSHQPSTWAVVLCVAFSSAGCAESSNEAPVDAGTDSGEESELWQMESMPGGFLWSLGGTSESDVWAVGSDGAIAHRDANQWSSVSSPTFDGLYAVSAVAPDVVWAVGESGRVLRYDGSGWEVMTSQSSHSLDHVIAVSSSEAWVLESGESPFWYDGSQWVEYPEVYGKEIASDGSTVWLRPSSGNYIWRWSGSAWEQDVVYEQAGSLFWDAIHVTAAGTVWLMGEGRLFRRTSGGWSQVDATGSSSRVNGLWGTEDVVWSIEGDNPSGLGIVDNGEKGIRMFDGSSWATEYHEDSGWTFKHIWGVSESALWVSDGDVWRRTP